MNKNIIDTAWNTTSKLPCLLEKGIKTVIRYYGVNTNNHPEKVLELKEARALSNAGLQIAVVFEMNNNSAQYFSYKKGYEHAQLACELASKINQPIGSAIYFAVDYDASEEDINNNIMPHFKGISDGITKQPNNELSYKIGIYGSGTVINKVKASYRWLSESMGWSGSRDALNNGNYELYQQMGTRGVCWEEAAKFDFDTKKTETTEIGTFNLGSN